MKTALPLTLLFVIFFYNSSLNAQSLFRSRPWTAQWIAAAGDAGTEYGVYYFRKNIELTLKPASFPVHVSADNRYKLYINGQLVSLGPARGDLSNWNFETVDLAPYLKSGRNNLSAIVWNEAGFRPEAQITLRTAFIMQGSTAAEDIINTDKTWKCMRDKGHQPIPGYFFAASTGEMVDMNLSVSNWWSAGLNDDTWPSAATLFEGKLKGMSDGFGWMLVPSVLPQMELKEERIPVLRKSSGLEVPANFPSAKNSITVPANSHVMLLLDQTHLTNAYVTIRMSRGRGSRLSISYAESMYNNIRKNGMLKPNRNVVEGMDFAGRTDSIICSGGDSQDFTTLNYRTFRYIRMFINTAEEPLVIDDLFGTFTGYPFTQTAVFNGADVETTNILDIGWRTARLNATETYMDCPYYEQLQYIGDTRIQAMVSYYYNGDDRLARNALNLMDRSRLPEGVTLSRYPTHSTQIIPTFSLWYIGMLYDYWMYRPDAAFIKDKLIGARGVLDFFSKYQSADGSLRNTPYWTFVDWANGKDWSAGSPPRSADGGSAIIDLQLLMAYQWMYAMETVMGSKTDASLYKTKAAQLEQTIRRRYWSTDKKLFADTDEKNLFSQHANTLAILTGLVKEADLPSLAGRLLSDPSLTQCTIYFKYYLHLALVKAGIGNDYRSWLGAWRNNIAAGLTTWAEEPDVARTRSDCHAWGSSPNIEFFRTVLGIDTDAPGFSKIRIEPHLGELTNAGGAIEHPDGKVSVDYKLENSSWKIRVILPGRTTGRLVWKSKTYPLKAGNNLFVIRAGR